MANLARRAVVVAWNSRCMTSAFFPQSRRTTDVASRYSSYSCVRPALASKRIRYDDFSWLGAHSLLARTNQTVNHERHDGDVERQRSGSEPGHTLMKLSQLERIRESKPMGPPDVTVMVPRE